MDAPKAVRDKSGAAGAFSIREPYAPRFCASEQGLRESYASFIGGENMWNFQEFNTQGYLYQQPSARRQFALVEMPNGCVTITRPGGREQIYENGKTCLMKSYLRGEAVCKRAPRAAKTQRADILVHNAYGKNRNNFQHFFMDHLGPLLAAEEQLSREPGARHLVDINGRSREILGALGFPMKRLVDYKVGTRYCAKRLMIPTLLPLDQAIWPHNKTTIKQVWLPEDFVIAGQWMARAYQKQVGAAAASQPRRLILYASRGSPAGKPHLSATGQVSARPSRNIANDQAVIEFLHNFVASRPELGLEVKVYYGGFTSIQDSLAAFQQARVVVGVHGANMANIAMAAADKGTAVVEFVGVRVREKYESFLSYFYYGRSSAMDYYNVPKRCSDKKCDKMHVETYDIQAALLDIFDRPQPECTNAI